MMKLRWLSLMALVLFLAACGDPVEPPPAAAITLVATPATLTNAGGQVKLDVTVDSGTVTAVEFFENNVSINKDATAPFTFTKTVPANTGAAKDFIYRAVGTTDTGTVASENKTVKQAAGGTTPPPPPPPGGPGSGATVTATSVQAINGAPENANIVVQNNIVCSAPNQDTPTPQAPDGDPCITLKTGQKLSAATPGLKITSDIPVGFGNSDDSAKITVVKMANNTAVEGFSFDGADIYTAIEAPAAVTGPVFVTNVTVVSATSNAPVRMVSAGELTINGLTLTTNRSLFIQDFTKATLTNLNLTFERIPAATGAALSINTDAATSEAIIDGLNVTTNLGGVGKDGVFIQNSADTTVGGNMTVTVKNSTVTFGATADLATSIAFNFNKVGAGTYTILGAASTGNVSNSTSQFEATYGPGVTGGPIGIQ
jgi:hypothetical protein